MISPISTRVREIVADVLCVIPETVNRETRLPECMDSDAPCDACRIREALEVYPDRLGTVSDIIAYIEAREVEGRG
jgi:hypothetical protein